MIASQENYSQKGVKTCVVGWDAGCLPYLEPLLSQGLLPNLASLIDAGAHGELISTIPPMTPVAWSSILTGCNPAKHGIFDWWRPVGSTYELVPYDSSSLRVPTLFRILSGAGLKIGAVNVPMTAPATAVNGFMLGGISHPGEGERLLLDSLYPQEVGDYVRREHSEFFEMDPEAFADATDNDALLDLWEAHEALRLRVIVDLVETEQPDLLWVHCHAGDYFGHREPRSSAVLTRAFQLVDKTIGQLQEHVDPDTSIWVISDHGQTEISKFILVQNWLEHRNWTVFRPDIPKERFGNTLLRLLATGSIPLAQEDLEDVVMAFAELNYNLPADVKQSLAKFANSLVPGALKDHGNIDWENTRAYCCGFYGQIRVNLKGRDPLGVVPPAEYGSVVSSICEQLNDLRDNDTGEHVGVRAFPRDSIYSGSALEAAPDILCELTDHSYYFCPIHGLHLGKAKEVVPIDHEEIGRTFRFIDQNFRGDHTDMGFFALKGPLVRTRGRQRPMRAIDVAPTLLQSLGFEAPEYMDGTAQAHLLENRGDLLSLQGVGADLTGDARAEHSKLVAELRTLGYRL